MIVSTIGVEKDALCEGGEIVLPVSLVGYNVVVMMIGSTCVVIDDEVMGRTVIVDNDGLDVEDEMGERGDTVIVLALELEIVVIGSRVNVVTICDDEIEVDDGKVTVMTDGLKDEPEVIGTDDGKVTVMTDGLDNELGVEVIGMDDDGKVMVITDELDDELDVEMIEVDDDDGNVTVITDGLDSELDVEVIGVDDDGNVTVMTDGLDSELDVKVIGVDDGVDDDGNVTVMTDGHPDELEAIEMDDDGKMTTEELDDELDSMLVL